MQQFLVRPHRFRGGRSLQVGIYIKDRDKSFLMQTHCFTWCHQGKVPAAPGMEWGLSPKQTIPHFIDKKQCLKYQSGTGEDDRLQLKVMDVIYPQGYEILIQLQFLGGEMSHDEFK